MNRLLATPAGPDPYHVVRRQEKDPAVPDLAVRYRNSFRYRTTFNPDTISSFGDAQVGVERVGPGRFAAVSRSEVQDHRCPSAAPDVAARVEVTHTVLTAASRS